MLNTTLKGLEGKGPVTRRQFEEVPPRVEYSLIEGGLALALVFDTIAPGGRAVCRFSVIQLP